MGGQEVFVSGSSSVMANDLSAGYANPVDGFWCSACGWAGRVEEDGTDGELHSKPQFKEFAEYAPRFCPHCGAFIGY